MIEHNLDVLASSDYLVDLGPEGGEGGGEIVALGNPCQIASLGKGHTAHCLKKYLEELENGNHE
jgi:excinuclease ABC subunit A